MRILHRHDDGGFKAIIRQFEHEGVKGAPLFQRADYEPLMEKIQLRANRGVLRGEMGHPHIGAGYDDDYRNQRCLSIYEDKVCCAFTDVKFERILDFGDMRSTVSDTAEPRAIETITAVVKPCGPFGAVFEDVLKFPDIYEFSTRAFSRGWSPDGPRLDLFVTWDLIPASQLAQVIRLKDLQFS